jgi:LysR family glycine cleavage system transcriptional activator
VQAALAGGGVALGRLPLILGNLQRGELVEPFGPAHRMASPFAYWLIDLATGRGSRPEVTAFAQWLREQAALTQQQMDTAVNAATP